MNFNDSRIQTDTAGPGEGVFATRFIEQPQVLEEISGLENELMLTFSIISWHHEVRFTSY